METLKEKLSQVVNVRAYFDNISKHATDVIVEEDVVIMPSAAVIELINEQRPIKPSDFKGTRKEQQEKYDHLSKSLGDGCVLSFEHIVAITHGRDTLYNVRPIKPLPTLTPEKKELINKLEGVGTIIVYATKDENDMTFLMEADKLIDVIIKDRSVEYEDTPYSRRQASELFRRLGFRVRREATYFSQLLYFEHIQKIEYRTNGKRIITFYER